MAAEGVEKLEDVIVLAIGTAIGACTERSRDAIAVARFDRHPAGTADLG